MGESPTFVVVARAESSARLRPDQEVVFEKVPAQWGYVTAVERTRWTDEGHDAPVPRELFIEVRGPAPDLEQASREFMNIARFFGTMTAFTANVEVGLVDFHLAYDDTPGSAEREFLQAFVPFETGLLREGRLVDGRLLAEIPPAALRHRDRARIVRAMAQYELALRDWRLGTDLLSLSHLFIAAEALGAVVVRARMAETGMTHEALARSMKIDPADPSRPRWKELLAARLREEIVFRGDTATYQAARQASDGFEHGYMDFSELNAHARTATLASFRYLRRAILDLLDVSNHACDALAEIEPRDVRSLRRLIFGKFIGAGDPAREDQRYPMIDWKSKIGRLAWEGDLLRLQFADRLTIVCGDGIGFQAAGFGARGRPEEGQPWSLDPSDIHIVETAPDAPDAI